MKYKIATILAVLAAFGYICLAMAFYVRLWPFELAVSIAPLVLAVLGVFMVTSAVLAVVARRSRPVGNKKYILPAALLLGFVAGAYCLVFTLTAQTVAVVSQTNEAQTIRFATFNKHYANTDYVKIADYIKQQNIDIVVLQELSTQETKQISKLSGLSHVGLLTHTYSQFSTSDGIISRLPIVSTADVELSGGFSLMRSEIEVSKTKHVAVYNTHVVIPSSNDRYYKSLSSFVDLPGILAAEKLPILLGGDFNAAVFSPKMRQFNKDVAGIVKPTTTERWPQCSWHGYGALLCMRIDHIYIPQTAALGSTTISPDLGSDHRMVVVDVEL